MKKAVILEALEGFSPKGFVKARGKKDEMGCVTYCGSHRFDSMDVSEFPSAELRLCQSALTGQCEYGKDKIDVWVASEKQIAKMLSLPVFGICKWESYKKVKIGEGIYAIFFVNMEFTFGFALAKECGSKVESMVPCGYIIR